MQRTAPFMLLTAVLLAAALPAGAQDMPPAPPAALLTQGTMLNVVAEGRSTRVPDVAVIRAGVVINAPTASAALSQNSVQMSKVLAALKAAGVAERDVQTERVSLQPQYRYENNQPPQLTGYQASNTVSVRFRDIARSGAILDALVNQGANSIEGPNFLIDQPEAAMDEARIDAVKRARARAELYAQAAGLRVDRILSISEGAETPGPLPMPTVRMMAAKDASTPVVAGEQEVNVTLMVRFLLK